LGNSHRFPSNKRGTALAGECVISSNKLNEEKSPIFGEGCPAAACPTNNEKAQLLKIGL